MLPFLRHLEQNEAMQWPYPDGLVGLQPHSAGRYAPRNDR